METSDKQLLRQGNYSEALGDNYVHKAVYIMLFKDGECIDQLQEHFSTKEEAVDWLKENTEPLEDGSEWYFGNINSDWL
jgi:hypothetical protein